MRLEGKTAVVTGAASGMDAVEAELFALEGARVYACDVRDEPGREVVDKIRSCGGDAVFPLAAYTASKWALRGVSKTAALEFADWGIRVNTIHPGLVHTPIIAGTVAYDAMSSMTPMARAADADEFARVALFLASDDSSFMTGVDLPVDGGFEAVSAYRRVWQIAQGKP